MKAYKHARRFGHHRQENRVSCLDMSRLPYIDEADGPSGKAFHFQQRVARTQAAADGGKAAVAASC